jgi:hypothetical protein
MQLYLNLPNPAKMSQRREWMRCTKQESSFAKRQVSQRYIEAFEEVAANKTDYISAALRKAE